MKIFVKILHIPRRVAQLLVARFLAVATPIRANRVVFVTSTGRYDCNPKWICEEILRRKPGWEVVWSYRGGEGDRKAEFPRQVRLVKYESLSYYRALAGARMIVDNSISVAYSRYRPKKGQTFVETWHGSLGIKRTTPEDVNDRFWRWHAFRTGSFTDYCISNGSFENEIYEMAFWPKTPKLPFGHARNDILCPDRATEAAAIREKVRRQLGVPSADRICLYAPTYRDKPGGNGVAVPDVKRLKDSLSRRFGGTWTVWCRSHFRCGQLGGGVSASGMVDVSGYSDIQELLTAVDVGITDYSSWICEYMLTGRPGFIYAPDVEDFTRCERGLYYPLSELPFPVARSDLELGRVIVTFDESAFAVRRRAFLAAKGSTDDGHAAERTADWMAGFLRGTE